MSNEALNPDENQEANFGDFTTGNLALAAAMATRLIGESKLQSEILLSLAGHPGMEMPSHMVTQSRIGMTALYLMRLEDPERQITLAELTDQMIDASAMSSMVEFAREQSEGEIDLDAAELRKLMTITISSAGGSQPAKTPLRSGLAAELETVRLVAQEKGVTAIEVYARDDLFYETMARLQTPSEFADAVKGGIVETEGVDIQEMMTRLAGNIPADSGMLGDDVAERFKALEDNPVMLAFIEAQLKPIMDMVAESGRQAFLYSLVKRYGYDSVNELTEEQRDALLPKAEKLNDLVAEAIRNSK